MDDALEQRHAAAMHAHSGRQGLAAESEMLPPADHEPFFTPEQVPHQAAVTTMVIVLQGMWLKHLSQLSWYVPNDGTCIEATRNAMHCCHTGCLCISHRTAFLNGKGAVSAEAVSPAVSPH